MDHTMFMPHGWCLTWNSRLIFLHVATDAAVALSYYSIPMALFVVAARKNQPLPLRPLLVLFGLFIAFCGGGHIIDIISIWHPIYWFKGWWNVGTASTSLLTAITLMPKAADYIRLPQTAERLSRERARLLEHNTLLHSVQDAISEAIVLVDDSGAVRLCNRTAERMLGSVPATGKQFPASHWIGWLNHQATDADSFTDSSGRVLERFTTAVPGYGQIYVLRDVTERVRSEAARRRLEQVIGTMNQGFSISSVSTGRILSTNTAFNEMHGYAAGELDGAPAEQIFAGSPEEKTDVAAAIVENATQSSCWEGETLDRRKDGSTFHARTRVNLHEEQGDRLLSSIVTDITDEKRREEEARKFHAKMLHTQKLESLGVLAGGVAHDFNNLLTGIMGNASLALDSLPGWSPLRVRLQDIVRASECAAELTRQLLAYSGKGRFMIQPLDLSSLIDDITELIKLSIPRTVSLRLNLQTVPPVEADSGQMQQLLMNIIINGAEAIGDAPGDLTVSTRLCELTPEMIAVSLANRDVQAGQYVCCEIQDNGSGMEQNVLSQIFDPFFTTKFTGRGLGLAAVLGIVNSHHGALHVTTELGKGTSFRVYLPVCQSVPETIHEQEPTPESSLASSADAGSFGGNGVVLVVDDEEVVRLAARNALSYYGYEVLLAENGEQALAIFSAQAQRISLVLLDLTMPVMTGEDTLHGLRQIDPGVKVLLTSGFNEAEAVQRFTRQGLAGFIQKPYTSARLAEKVKSTAQKCATSEHG